MIFGGITDIIQDISLREESGIECGGCHGRFIGNPGESTAKLRVIRLVADTAGGVADCFWNNGYGKADGADGNGGN